MNNQHFTLYEISSNIRTVLEQSFPEACWITAEIADLKLNQKGHCYLELLEKRDGKTIAQMKATIWAYDYRKIAHKFQKATEEPLRQGMNILFLAEITFHEVYGLSLNIKDIEPSYTLGEMARKKREIIERLRREGVIDLNKAIPMPDVPQRIAVISSPTAAGYMDFFKQLDNNPYGYVFTHILFPSVMQGPETEKSVIDCLQQIKKKKSGFDIVVIIRGGGSVIDLNWFDSYPLALEITGFPLPVITGIGHEKDDTVADIVAHTKMKTPTAVAEFLISGMNNFEASVLDLYDRMRTTVQRLLKDADHDLAVLSQKLSFVPLRTTAEHGGRILLMIGELKAIGRRRMQEESSRLNSLDQALRHLDPANVLKRGYSITRHKGKIVRDAKELKKWAVIETRLLHGNVTSIVQEKKEEREGEQKQTANLLPGFN